MPCASPLPSCGVRRACPEAAGSAYQAAGLPPPPSIWNAHSRSSSVASDAPPRLRSSTSTANSGESRVPPSSRRLTSVTGQVTSSRRATPSRRTTPSRRNTSRASASSVTS